MYEDFYKLAGKPFQLSPDARFFFNSSGHNRAMAYLRYGMRQGEGFIVITGGIGTGKSMLVANLFREIESEDLIAAQLVSTQIGDDDVLRMVCASFGLAHEGVSKASMLKDLEDFFRTAREEGKRVLLVVDEAQNLPQRSIEELRMLSNYQQDGQALLQSFLIGQPELKRTLAGSNMEQVRQRIIAGFHLRALDQEEMRAYIEHRLTLVGWDGSPAITDEAYAHLFEATAGVPRRVNTMVDRLLLYGALEELREITGAHVDAVVNEVAQEVGHIEMDEDNVLNEELPVAPASYAGMPDSDLLARVESLEATVTRLKEQADKDRRMIKKAILLNLEMDGDA